jgi:hypothetical protein
MFKDVPTRPPHSAHASTQGILNIYSHFITLILIINIQHDVLIEENIFINNYTLDESTYSFKSAP